MPMGKVAGFERANTAGRPSSTDREDDCLKRIQATHIFLPMGEGMREERLRMVFSY